MFDKLVKMRNRKGFTLVEMLVVIAIIAALVAVVVPVVGTSLVKSAAATNAANLRSIEGKISTMRVEYPDAFEDALAKATTNLQDALGENYTLVNDLMGAFGYESVDEFIESGHALAELATYSLYHTTAVNGVLTISGGAGDDLVIENVPTAKAIDIENMKVEDGTEMTVYITDRGILATYEEYSFTLSDGSSGDSYTRLDFAEVAETGKFTKESGSGGTSYGDVAADVEEHYTNVAKCELGLHEAGENCKCIHCGDVAHYGGYTTDGQSGHTCNACGTPSLSHSWRSGFCSVCGYACTHGSYSSISDRSHMCSTCNKTFDHNFSTGTCVCGKDCPHTSWTTEGTCAACGKECEHAWELTNNGYLTSKHYCPNCTTTGNHTGTSDCSTCEATTSTTINCKKYVEVSGSNYCGFCGHSKYKHIGTSGYGSCKDDECRVTTWSLPNSQ